MVIVSTVVGPERAIDLVPGGLMRVAWHEVPGLEFGHFGRVSGRGTERGLSQRGASIGKIEEFSSGERMML